MGHDSPHALTVANVWIDPGNGSEYSPESWNSRGVDFSKTPVPRQNSGQVLLNVLREGKVLVGRRLLNDFPVGKEEVRVRLLFQSPAESEPELGTERVRDPAVPEHHVPQLLVQTDFIRNGVPGQLLDLIPTVRELKLGEPLESETGQFSDQYAILLTESLIQTYP